MPAEQWARTLDQSDNAYAQGLLKGGRIRPEISLVKIGVVLEGTGLLKGGI